MNKARTPKTGGATLQTRIYESGSNTYILKAPSYATTNSSWWQIKMVDQDSGNRTMIKWADGNQYFDNKADDYKTLTYK